MTKEEAMKDLFFHCTDRLGDAWTAIEYAKPDLIDLDEMELSHKLFEAQKIISEVRSKFVDKYCRDEYFDDEDS